MKIKTIEQSFTVNYSYQLLFTEGVFSNDNLVLLDIISAFKSGSPVKLLFVLDQGLLDHHPGLENSIAAYCHEHASTLEYSGCLVVPGGEAAKNDSTSVNRVLEAINSNGICRHSFVVVVGGGAVIDMAGYAAAIAHRGVKLIRVPTTVLSQNDAAVGVKNSINTFGKKNFLGTFAPPYAIINDAAFLKTLEQRDWIAGVAEAIKVALIQDADFFGYIREHTRQLRYRDLETMQYVIYRCAEMHMKHIAKGGDPFESGSSRPLDFGHWAAHKMEYMTGYQMRHGEAVARGIALDLMYSKLTKLISDEEFEEIIGVLEQLGFQLQIPVKGKKEKAQLLEGIREFREHLGGELTITLINGIGKKHDVHEIDHTLMLEAIHVLNDRVKLNVT